MSLLGFFGSVVRPRQSLAEPAVEAEASSYPAVAVSTPAAKPPGSSETQIPAESEPLNTPVTGDDSEEPEDAEPTQREKRLMLQLSNVSHGVNHFQNQMMTMLYPSIMLEIGMTYFEVGVLSGIRSMVTSTAQGCYGFVTPFISRCKILGFSNFGIALGTFLSGIAWGYPMLVFARGVAALGSSAQHPVGYSILSSYFPKERGKILAINTSASNIGTLIATPLATAMLLIMPWRSIFFVVAFASIIMGAVYLMFRDYGSFRGGTGKARLSQGFSAYKRVIKNKNMMLIALVFMVGAAGSEGGVNQTYFAPHLANDFGYGALVIGILITAMNVGQIVGPIFFGWLSDRMSRKAVLQSSLALSAIGTLWVAHMGPGEVMLFISFFIYSAVTSSRGTLTQTIVADSADDRDRDAAFSLYFFLGFLAQPMWLLVTGFLMDNGGFSVAVSRLAISYLLAIILLIFVTETRKGPASAIKLDRPSR